MDKNDVIESFLEQYVLPSGRDAARKALDAMLIDAHNDGYNEGYDDAEPVNYEGPWSIGL
mgnify:CR=1 FL=1